MTFISWRSPSGQATGVGGRWLFSSPDEGEVPSHSEAEGSSGVRRSFDPLPSRCGGTVLPLRKGEKSSYGGVV